MNDAMTLARAAELVRWFQRAAAGLMVLALMAGAVGLLWPFSTAHEEAQARGEDLAVVTDDGGDIELLIRRMSGRRLIRPSQAQAAVLDNGASARMLKLLTLRGVIKISDTYVAYVQIQNESEKRVIVGDKLLEFVVEDIQPGIVKLSLNGVDVTLGQ